MKKLAIFSLLIVFATSCKCKKADSASDFTILKESGYGGRAVESHELITNEMQYANLAKELHIENPATVDFAKNNAIAIFMGEKRTGGYSITIEKVTVNDDTAMVLVKNTVPEPGATLTMAITQPYCIAMIPKTDKAEVKENPVNME